jgi:hypothetical protein
VAFVLAFEAARRVRTRDATIGDYVRWCAPGLAFYLLWFGWRWHYYGLPLPTTYYAKALIAKALPGRGWEYVRQELATNGTLLAIPFAAYLVARRSLSGALLVLFALVHAAYVVEVGGDWMPYGRFVLPIAPLVVVVVVWAALDLAEVLGRRLRWGARPWLALPAAFLVFVVGQTERHLTRDRWQREKMARASEQASHVEELKVAARLLNRAMTPGARLATDYAGIFSYYTDAAPIDMWGLCNAVIAVEGTTEGINPVYGKTCPRCYPRLDPELFHVSLPIVRGLDAFHGHAEVVASVWQSGAIGRYLDLQDGFVTGRVMAPERGQAVYFLERASVRDAYRPRGAGDGIVVDYPFELGGRAPGL